MSLEVKAALWLIATIALYALALVLYERHPRWWTAPLLVTWGACVFLIVVCHSTYQEYFRGTHWLVLFLGPATIAFALPVYEQRDLIRRHWVILLAGTLVGSGIALGTSWLLASWLHLSPEVRASLLPRSVTTPFALDMAHRLGGGAELTASLTAVTGLFGAAVGEILLKWLPLRSSFAKGAMYGMGAHGAGVARAREIGHEEGAVAGVIMILAGLMNVLGVAAFVMIYRL